MIIIVDKIWKKKFKIEKRNEECSLYTKYIAFRYCKG